MKRVVLSLTAVLSFLLAVPAAYAGSWDRTVPLPVDFQPEGIARGVGSTFYVGSLRTGDIYRGDLRTGVGAILVHAPAGRAAVGIKADVAHSLLFVAGGASGAAYVYDLSTGAPVAEYQFAAAGSGGLLNDVVLTGDAAYFTDSFLPTLYTIPIGPDGTLGVGAPIPLSGPAADIEPGINLNGITATANGRTLIVGHTELGALFTVDPATGASQAIGVTGIVAGTPDGLLLAGRTLYVVENSANTVLRVRLTPDLASGSIASTITSPLFDVPTTVAKFGPRLALVNGRFDLGAPPPFGPGAPPGTEFDVVVVPA